MSIFLYMAILGVGFLLLSLLSGHDHDFSHDEISIDNESPGFFSVRIISIFIATAGCTGMIAGWYGLNETISSIVAFLGGLLFANIARKLIDKLISYQSQSNMDSNYDGLVGTVTLSIPSNGPGEVNVKTKNNQTTWITAYAADKEPIEIGETIKIISSSGNTVSVSKIINK